MTTNQAVVKLSFFYQLTLYVGILLLIPSTIAVVDFALHPLDGDFFYGSSLYRVSTVVLGVLTIALAGLCIRRVPGNATATLLLIFGSAGLLASMRNTASVEIVLTFGLLGVVFFWMTFIVFLSVYPTGQPYFRRTGTLMNYCWIAGFSLLAFASATGTPEYAMFIGVLSSNQPNPFYIPYVVELLPIISGVMGLFSFPYLGLILISQVLRFWRGSILERQQMKWFLLWLVLWLVPQFVVPLIPAAPEWLLKLKQNYGIIVPSVFPLVVAYAILRHRLYDIDIIIRRTLIYSLLSAILAAVYFGSVIVVQALFQSATGEVPDAAIVLSTLLIAALFTPVRRRVQDVIDRRFYRRKYDVEQTLAEFNATLRDEVDMETLQANLLRVVNDTMQPSSIRLWVKE